MDDGTAGRVFVVGSANRDLSVAVPSAPVVGETLLASGLTRSLGGKGANQAVAAARSGADVSFIGAVGIDPDGDELVAAMSSEGIDTAAVVRTDEAATGTAIVQVLPDGGNQITVVAAANAFLTPEQVRVWLQSRVGVGDVVAVSAEIPIPTVAAAVGATRACGARAVLNLAPYRVMELDVLASGDPLVVNGAEAAAVTGREVRTVAEARAAARDLAAIARSAIVTMGAAGAVVAGDAASAVHVPAPAVPTVDTTGAGDAFVGALAAALSAGVPLPESTERAVLAAASSVQGRGAQASYVGAGQRRGSSR